ncbi:MAG: LysR-family transcriptional regulator [Bradyrhizobium sp.]|nr:LysR-family transcriptional regulator [Bradyrhizobium sp.]
MLSFTHLAVFEAILQTKSVSRAAEALDLPQPSVSRYLRQLRDHFSNQLFVRTRHGLEPTSFASTTAPAVSETLELYRSRLSGGANFDPTHAQRSFSIAASDIGLLLVIPRLVKWARQIAPGIQFNAVPLTGDKLIAKLEAGEVDIAVGTFPSLQAGIREQTLFRQQYVCLVPRSFLPTGKLTIKRFKEAHHVLVNGRHLGHAHEEAEKILRNLVGRANITVVTDSFLLSAHIAEQSDMILTAPASVADMLSGKTVRIVRPPMELPQLVIRQYWHERFHEDAGNIWLRHLVARLRGLDEILRSEEKLES